MMPSTVCARRSSSSQTTRPPTQPGLRAFTHLEEITRKAPGTSSVALELAPDDHRGAVQPDDGCCCKRVAARRRSPLRTASSRPIRTSRKRELTARSYAEYGELPRAGSITNARRVPVRDQVLDMPWRDWMARRSKAVRSWLRRAGAGRRIIFASAYRRDRASPPLHHRLQAQSRALFSSQLRSRARDRDGRVARRRGASARGRRIQAAHGQPAAIRAQRARGFPAARRATSCRTRRASPRGGTGSALYPGAGKWGFRGAAVLATTRRGVRSIALSAVATALRRARPRFVSLRTPIPTTRSKRSRANRGYFARVPEAIDDYERPRRSPPRSISWCRFKRNRHLAGALGRPHGR